MRNRIKQLRDAFRFAKDHSITMQRRMMLYFVCLCFALFGLLVFILLSTGLLFNAEQHVRQGLALHLRDVGDAMDDNLELLAGHAAVMSGQISDEIDNVLREGEDISKLNNESEKLLELQKAFYPVLNTSLQVTQSSGVYAVVNATTNTEAPGAENSRSGMYLRLTNISGNVSLTPSVVYFRGIPDIAREKGLELHNRWNLEFDISQMPWYESQLRDVKPRMADNCRLTRRIGLPRTWEKAVYVTAPVLGKNGEIYGSCGIELSSLCFRLFYPAAESEYGSIFTVLAPVRDGKLMLSEGISGEQSGSALSDTAELIIEPGKNFDTFRNGKDLYIGLLRKIRLKGYGDTEWAAVVLVPRDSYLSYASKGRYVWMCIVFCFFIVMVAASFFLSKRFVKPIVKKLDTIREGRLRPEEKSGISEIDELVAFLKETKERPGQNQTGGLPHNIEELFEKFESRAELLSGAERSILNYYIDGYEISEIPSLACISMSTVRTHNRNIYKKLEVSSRDELMLYLDLLKRCGRLERLGL